MNPLFSGEPLALAIVVLASLVTFGLFLAYVRLTRYRTKHRPVRLALLASQLLLLGTLAAAVISADAAIQAHAHRTMDAARLDRLAVLLQGSYRLFRGRYPAALELLERVPELRREDLLCPMDGQPYTYRVSPDGQEVELEGRPSRSRGLGAARHVHRLRVSPARIWREWRELEPQR